MLDGQHRFDEANLQVSPRGAATRAGKVSKHGDCSGTLPSQIAPGSCEGLMKSS